VLLSKTMLPDLESLRCFVAATERPSFRLAASAVALSPAAFGARIKALEETLGARLFERTTRSVQLSTAGRRLLPEARQCLDQARRCALAVHEDRPLPLSLTLGTRYELGLSFVLPALDALQAARPTRRIHLRFGDTPDVLGALLRRQLDCMLSSARLSERDLEYARVHEERYVFVGRRDRLKRAALRGARDAAAHVLLDISADLPLFRYLLDARPSDEPWRFAEHQYLGTIAAVRARVLAGAGVAVLPHYFVRDALRDKTLVQILPGTSLPSDWFRLVWRRGHPEDTALRELAAELAARPLR
jgi:LysR family glycine cleavage system transcriptional activator